MGQPSGMKPIAPTVPGSHSLYSLTGEPFSFRPPGRLLDFMREAGDPNLINLAAGVPSPALLPTSQLADAFARGLRNDGGAMFAYHEPEGDPQLRELLASRVGLRGIEVESSGIVITTGCTQALQLALDLLCKPGDVVACECPVYYGLLELLSHFALKILPLPLHGDEGIDIEMMEELLRKHRPRCLVVCSTLSNPSGATLPESRREQFVDICRDAGVKVIEDEVYAELCDGVPPKPLRSYDDGKTVFYVTSFSKTIAPGLRVGFAIPGPHFEEFAEQKCKQDMHGCVVSEVILREYLQGPAQQTLDLLKETFARRRTLARDAIAATFPADARVSNPRGGFMFWIELAHEVDLRGMQNELRKQRIAVAHGQVFFPRQEEERFMRLNCAKASEEDLVSGLRIVGHLLQE
jgi:DNA-binding transcriptional MocR family regulator